MNNAEEWISDVEDRIMEITQSGQQTENQIKKKQYKRPGDNIKWTNLCTMGIPEGEEKEKGIENIFEEIMTENFPNLKKTRYGKHRGPQTSWTQTDPHQDIL